MGPRDTPDRHLQQAAPHLGDNGIKPCLTPGIVPRVGVQHPAPIHEMRETELEEGTRPRLTPHKIWQRSPVLSDLPRHWFSKVKWQKVLSISKVKQIIQRVSHSLGIFPKPNGIKCEAT